MNPTERNLQRNYKNIKSDKYNQYCKIVMLMFIGALDKILYIKLRLK